jgi:hypothetical protein
MPVVQAVMNASQWVGSLLEVADQSQRAWFSVNPDVQKQLEVERAVLRARKALAALNAVAIASKSADDGDLVKAKADLIRAYRELEQLLLSLQVEVKPGMKAMEPPRITEAARVEAALGP